MEIEIFTLCDYAQDNNGKLTIVGTFDTMNLPNFPIQSPPCFLALRIRVGKDQGNQHSLRIRCVDEHNIELPQLSVEGGFNVMPNPGSPYTGINVVLGMRPIQIERPGRLTFELYIDGEWVRAIPLTVIHFQPRLAA